MMKMISNFGKLVSAIIAFFATTSCAYSQEYHGISHCWQNARTLDGLLNGVDAIGVVSIGEFKRVEGYEWEVTLFNIVEEIRGEISDETLFPVKIISADDPNFNDQLVATFERAKSHDNPKFIANDVRKFASYSDISQVKVITKKNGGKVPELIDGTCKRVPYLLQGVQYVLMLRGDKIVSIEPLFDKKDYWFEFIQQLIKNNYWPIYRDE